MDSPVIVDTASKFGRGIDLDRDIPVSAFSQDFPLTVTRASFISSSSPTIPEALESRRRAR